nr:probable serine racemase [Nerophis lumbriciformis]
MPTSHLSQPSAADIAAAAQRIAPYVHRTPVLTCRTLDQRLGAELFFKCENFQRVGAFKMRGASNTVASLSADELERGVTTHSSGNHAQALALAARLIGTQATIVMPENAPRVKLDAVRGYGAEVVLCEPTLEARERETEKIIDQRGAVLVHPFNDPRIVAGQATAARELLDEIADLDLILTPTGGGGLLSGTALTALYDASVVQVYGAEPAAADDARRSLKAGRRLSNEGPTKTICDGLLTSLGEVTWAIIERHVSDILTVTDEEVSQAMRLIWERMKIIVEPSAAVVLAVLLAGRLDVAGKKVGLILSGGNVDLGNLSWLASSN